jgi:hypothetical protein
MSSDHHHHGYRHAASKAVKSGGAILGTAALVALVLAAIVSLVIIVWPHVMGHDGFERVETHTQPVCLGTRPNPPAQGGLGEPNLGTTAWTCSGRLAAWGTVAFHPYPSRSQSWCRISEHAHPEALEYRLVSKGKACRSGRLMFITRPPVEAAWDYWYDPQLRVWLTAFEGGINSLRGNTRCNGKDAWVYIDVAAKHGGPFFTPANQACLKRYNATHGLKPPASFKLIHARAILWTGDPRHNQGRWFDLVQAPLCLEAYKAESCATAR